MRHVEHPLLTAELSGPGGRGTTFTGRLSFASQPWLRDHAVFDRVLLPATALSELVLAAGRSAGVDVLEELTFEAPLILADGDDRALQVVVGAADEDGRRPVQVYSQEAPGDEDDDGWVRHADGLLATGDAPAAATDFATSWPPPDGEPIDPVALYDRLADVGLGYGPAFQGLRAAWRVGDAVYAEVALDDEHAEGADAYGVHPALLDAALHAVVDDLSAADANTVPLPFAMHGLRVHRAGATRLRVRLSVADDGASIALVAADEDARPVIEVDTLAARPVDAAGLGARSTRGNDSLFRHEWVEIARGDDDDADAPRLAVLGDGELPGAADAISIATADGLGDSTVDAVLVAADGLLSGGGDAAERAHRGTAVLLELLQAWIADESRDEAARMVVVTRGAMAVTPGDAPDPAAAALWGLVRSAQSEHPQRFLLVDLEPDRSEELDWAALLGAGEPQLAVRHGNAYALRVTRLHDDPALVAPDGPWRLDSTRTGTLDLALVASERAAAPLAADEVRVAMRAGGLNFRDVLIALGEYPDDDPVGSEGAGVVLETGDDVAELAPGDRVFGLTPEAFAPVAVTDARLLARTPQSWTDPEAASVPIVFATAYYGLVDLAALQAGERVLVHAGAGGVGMAAIQLAQHLGAEVFATASPGKWDVLRELGLPDDHIASSRDLAFAERFRDATGGEGVDVVLNALAGEYVEASLTLLPRGGRFVEMGKADRRDPEEIAAAHPGVAYRSYDLVRDAGAERVGAILGEVVALFEAGTLRHLPLRALDVRRASSAFRLLGDGRNVGKLVLTVPRSADPDGTVLITGGTGDLGARVARHLAGGGIRHLLLVSRRGPDAPGVDALLAELRELGAEPVVAACDVADRDALAALLGEIDAAHPLTGVVHTAGVLADATIASLTPEQLERVLRPKVDAALALHELTAGADLAEFILFSSDSGTIGVPGQGNYAAANVFLDALAELRRAEGRPARSMAWGLWSDATGMAAELGEAELARLSRLGVAAMSNELELFDAARQSAATVVVPTKLDMPALRAAAEAGTLAPLMRAVVRERPRRAARAAETLVDRLAAVAEDEREEVVLRAVCDEVAAVLGHASGGDVETSRKFRELGFDSLSAVELRNRLSRLCGQRLPSTLIFDHPSPIAVSRHLVGALAPAAAANGDGHDDEAVIRRLLASISLERLRAEGLLDQLVSLAGTDDGATEPSSGGNGGDGGVDDLDVDELVRMARPTS